MTSQELLRVSGNFNAFLNRISDGYELCHIEVRGAGFGAERRCVVRLSFHLLSTHKHTLR